MINFSFCSFLMIYFFSKNKKAKKERIKDSDL